MHYFCLDLKRYNYTFSSSLVIPNAPRISPPQRNKMTSNFSCLVSCKGLGTSTRPRKQITSNHEVHPEAYCLKWKSTWRRQREKLENISDSHLGQLCCRSRRWLRMVRMVGPDPLRRDHGGKRLCSYCGLNPSLQQMLVMILSVNRTPAKGDAPDVL